MRIRAALALATVPVALSACSGVTVNYDFDPNANFPGYSSWAWMEMRANPQLTDLQQSRVRSSVETALAAKGMERVRGEPDFWVGYQVILDEEISYNTVNTHVRNIYRKLAVNTRAEAVIEAIQMGIIPSLSNNSRYA